MLTAHKAREKMMADSGILTIIKRAIDMSCSTGNTRAVIYDAVKDQLFNFPIIQIKTNEAKYERCIL